MMAVAAVALLALLSSAVAQPTNTTNTTTVFINLDPEVTKDSLVPNSLPVRGTLWASNTAYAWTDDGSASFIVAVDYASLEDANATTAFTRSQRSFRAAGDFAVQAGLYVPSPATLYLWGSNVLYRVADLANLEAVEANVSFPSLILAHTGFAIGNTVYTPQWSPAGTLPPQLFATDLSQYTAGFGASTTASDLVFDEMASSKVDAAADELYVAYNGGEIEIRTASAVDNVKATVRLTNITQDGAGLAIGEIFVDSANKLLYVVGTQEGRGWVGRLNISDVAALDGLTFTVYDPSIIATTTSFPNATTDATKWLAIPLGTSTNVLATALAVDVAIGVGYANLNDQASRIGYLVKFDAVNMRALGSEVITLFRDETLIVSMYLRPTADNKRALHVATSSSFSTFIDYPTSCSNDCNSILLRGSCERSKCVCVREWSGDACEEEACVNGCGEAESRGTCRKGVCQCSSDFTGDTCAQRRCPNDCSGNGVCDNSTYICSCDATHIGRACELDKFSSCEGLNEDADAYNLCLQFEACGWCFDEGLCKEGTRAGPAQGSCRQWLVDSTYDVITVIFGAIIIFCFLVMFIINVISALMEDWRLATIMSTEGNEGDSTLARTQWWRDERSAKSWKLWDQLQFMSYFSIINAVFSTRLVQFTGYFNWANFSLPWIFVDDSFKPERTSSFVTNSIEQYANAHGVSVKMVYFNALIWWTIATACFLAAYLLYYILVVFILRKGGRFSEILMHRVFHIITRSLLAGYLPLVLLAAFYITNYQDGLMAVPIIFGLLIAVGVPVLNFLVVKGEKTDFLYYSLRIRFGAFYVSYQHTRTKFAFVVFARKFLVAALIGFLAANKIQSDQEVLFWVQSLIPAGLMLVYIVLLVILNPYIDLVHTILDIVLNLINIITLATGYLHRSERVEDKTAGVFVAMILQIAGLVFVIFAFLWTWLFYAGYTSPGQLCGGKPEEDKDDGKKKPAEKKAEEKKKEDVKAVDATNLKDLEISESDS